MRKTALSIALAGTLSLPAAAAAQVSAGVAASFQLDLPVVLPALVVVQPGVQVIPEVDHEVFYSGGAYWTRHGGGWYRSPSPRSGWVLAPVHAVPVALVKIPPGHYKNWKPSKAHKEAAKAQKHEHKAAHKAFKKHGKH
ncbi:MAG TPA: hypothetical protein VFL83_10355 [Anaeromyxobacter sp.]|nr:hypothetical protein [Anaeromyxobacter sp.]